MAIANPQTTAVTINLNLNLNPDQEGHNIFYLLNRIRMNCRRLMFPQLLDHLASALRDSLQTVYNTTLNMEKVIFGIGYDEKSPAATQLSSCYEILRSLMPRFIEQVSLDGSAITKGLGFANVLHVVFLVFCDLHMIEALKLLIRYDYNDHLEGTPAIVYKLSQTQQDQFCKVVQKRQQQLVTKAQITLPTPKSICKVDSDDMKQLVDETFNPLTNKLVPQSRRQLASIMAYDECVCTELRKLKDQLQKVKALSSDQSYACRSKLSFLMERIDQEINQFILEHFAGELPLANPRPCNITSRVNIPPSAHLPNHPKEDDVANSNSTNAGSSTYPVAEEDNAAVNEYPDSFDLSDIMEPSEEPDLDYTEPPSLLIQTIDRLCNENNIKDAVWSLSTRKPDLIVVNGQGITDERKGKLEQAMSAEFPGFQTEFINVELTSQNLNGVILQSTCNRYSSSPKWERHGTATCEVLLTGHQPHRKDREVLYAVTSAHLLLLDKEMKDIQDDESLQQVKLDIYRGEVNKRIGDHIYLFEPNAANGTNPLSVNLCNPALIAYRTYKHTAPTTSGASPTIRNQHATPTLQALTEDRTQHAAPTSQATATDTGQLAAPTPQTPVSQALSTETKPYAYRYMTDIALLPIEKGCHEQNMQDWMKTTNMSLIIGIKDFTANELEEFIKKSRKIYANNNREGKVHPLMLNNTNQSTSKPRALHLPFILTKGERFLPGDSGSLIYARYRGDDTKRVAIGILKGTRPKPEDYVYEAIVLKPAMEDIENDYRHLVKSLKLCTARKPVSTGGHKSSNQ